VAEFCLLARPAEANVPTHDRSGIRAGDKSLGSNVLIAMRSHVRE
jgi:hypothetical protein